MEYLNFNNSSDIESTTDSYSLNGLENLEYYGGDFNRSLHLTTEQIMHKDKIKGLKTELRTNDDIKLLLQFPNIESLSINYIGEAVTDFGDLYRLKNLKTVDLDTSPKDISWLSGITKLQHLNIQSGYEMTDFTALYSLTQLKSLSLSTADSLKDISFVQNMPNLTTLSLNRTAVMDLNPLNNKQSIQSLCLTDNTSLNNYSIIGNLSSLHKLEIDTTERYPNIPSLASLNQLTTLSLNSEFRNVISGNKSIQDLTLTGNIKGDLFYSDFPAIQQLTLKDASFYDLSSWNTIQSISDLTLEDITFIGSDNTYQLFKLPNIQSVTLIKTSLGMDADTFEPSNTLRSLDVSSNSSLGYDSIIPYLPKISECIQLEKLSLPNQSIQNLDFISPLTQLKQLDVEDNYITNVAPLAALPNLERVNLRENPVTNSDLLEKIIVIK